MSKGKYQNGKTISMKPLALLLAAVLLVGATIGGTLAWLQATTKEVENTFTDSDIGVTLVETKENFKMIPGHTIDKDPKVSVTKGSEDAWLFVKVTKSANYDTYLTHEYDDKWEIVVDETIDDVTKEKVTILGRKIDESDADHKKGVEYSVLKGDKVTTKEDVTKEMMNAIKDGTVDEPTLTFQAYAVQLMKDNTTEFDAATAWAKAEGMAPKTETTVEGGTTE